MNIHRNKKISIMKGKILSKGKKIERIPRSTSGRFLKLIQSFDENTKKSNFTECFLISIILCESIF